MKSNHQAIQQLSRKNVESLPRWGLYMLSVVPLLKFWTANIYITALARLWSTTWLQALGRGLFEALPEVEADSSYSAKDVLELLYVHDLRASLALGWWLLGMVGLLWRVSLTRSAQSGGEHIPSPQTSNQDGLER